MIQLKGKIQTLRIINDPKPACHHEAPWMHKRNGTYYLSYAAGWPEKIAYATSNAPLGPFTYRGIVLDRVTTGTNHQAIVEYNNQWYLFYHDSTLPDYDKRRERKRSVKIDCLFYNADGTIKPVVQTLKGIVAGRCGLPQPTPPARGPIQRLQSYNFQTRYIRHSYYRARIDSNVSPNQDSEFIVVHGLADRCAISFESVNFPGHYLRHRNYEIWLARYDGTRLFREDATWHGRPGLADSKGGWSSYESYNFPGKYLRHYNYLMILGTVSGSTQRADATFRMTAREPSGIRPEILRWLLGCR